jgi:hypothetical protein
MDKYKSSQRYHEVGWMLAHSEDLETKAKKQRDTSKIIYCCLKPEEIKTALSNSKLSDL